MKSAYPTKFFIILSVLFLTLSKSDVNSQVLYSNTGDNTTGLTTVLVSGTGGTITTNGTDLVESGGGRWDVLPVSVSGDFQISYQVYNDSNDGDSHFLLFNPVDYTGVDVQDSPQGTDTPTINIFSAGDLRTYNGFFIYTAPLIGAATTAFPNQTWTQITITRTGNILTDNVGGQILQYDMSNLGLPATLGVGLGAYASTTLGGNAQMLYRNIILTVPEASTSSLLIMSWILIGVMALIHDWKKSGIGKG